MLTHNLRWSHAPGNPVVPSRWQATWPDRGAGSGIDATSFEGSVMRLPVPRGHRRLFWLAIRSGLSAEDAAVAIGLSEVTGWRWFAEAGGMPPMPLTEPSSPARYVGLDERIAIREGLVLGHSYAQIGRDLSRSTSTISREGGCQILCVSSPEGECADDECQVRAAAGGGTEVPPGSSSPFGEPASQADAARRAVDAIVEAGLLDKVLAQVDTGELRLTGEGGFLPEMLRRSLEAGLRVELSDHLGYEKGDPAGQGSGNSRNGSTPKRLGTEVGDVDLATPRDRNGTFDPQLVGKGQRRLDGLADMIISLYAKGMTVRDIQHHLQSTLGSELSPETISNITEAVAGEVKAWQARPLEPVYPIVYLDALVVKVRDGHQVRNKAAHIAVGVDSDGVKHVLGIWVQTTEGAKFWAGVCAELANRGVRDVLIVCCDGLTGFPEAIEATWPNAVVQTCTVHLIRASLRFVPDSDRKAVAAALKMIYTAPTAAAAAQELDIFEGSNWGKKYPATVRVWRDAWERFIPFLEFPPALRRIIYTTNAIESLNYQLRKIIKNRGHFPNDDAVIKLLWLAIRDIEDRRARERAKEAGLPKGQPRKAPSEARRGRPGPALEPSPRSPHPGLPRPARRRPVT